VQLRYAYSLLLGLALQWLVFRDYMLPIYVQHLIVFAIIKVKGRRCGALVTVESMLFLSGYHVYGYLYNYGGWVMSADALLMILVCKYSFLAYNLEDGVADETKLTPEQLRNRITKELTVAEFLGYVSFLPTAIIGPPLEFNDYQRFMELQDVYASIPSVLPITLKTIAETALFAALYILGDTFVPISALKTDAFYEESLPYIVAYSTLSVYLLRCKYYFGWKLSMTAVHASGVSFSGSGFDRINTVNPWIFETSMHVRDKINNWNISVQEWLRKSVYQRSQIKSKSLNQLFVFVVSAFWHGLYFAYYISETLWFVQLHLQALMFKYFKGNHTFLNKLYEKMGSAGTVVLAALVSFEFNHNSTYFVILEGEYCWKFMKKLYFIPELSLVVLLVLFSVLPPPRSRKGAVEEAKKQ
jgi:lysophospholipid acyltransferase